MSEAATFQLDNLEVSFPSIEQEHSLNSMPGIYSKEPMVSGRYVQTMFVTGNGYTRVGVITHEQKTQHLSAHGRDWSPFTMMTFAHSHAEDPSSGCSILIMVDFTTRLVSIFCDGQTTALPMEVRPPGAPQLQLHFAVACKRCTQRSVRLLPALFTDILLLP